MPNGMTSPSLMIVEDDLALQKQIKWSLDRHESVTAADRPTALVQLHRHRPPVVTMDLGLPPDPDSSSEGFTLLEQMLQVDPHLKVIVLTGQNQQDHALKAVRLGAYDFIAKPFDPDVLGLVVERALRLHELQSENRRLQQVQSADALGGLITQDAEMMRISRMIERVAGSDATVLLLGESGTGKEVLAQGLHTASRRKGRFVAINCAAIPENLLESELFGYEKGAFTGAAKATPGKIETADGGTLMLDEIGDLPLPLQAKLLRFLQERTVERLGARREVPVDVRVVGATHQDLRALIERGAFREDLYYRLAEIEVSIPALRQRPGDAALLAQAFLRRFEKEQRRGPLALTAEALRAIEAHGWPGNVRQLLNVVKRATIMADGPQITPRDLGIAAPGVGGSCSGETGTGRNPESAECTDDPTVSAMTRFDLRSARERAERQAVQGALSTSQGNIQRAAELLGVSRPTLYDLMSRLNLK